MKCDFRLLFLPLFLWAAPLTATEPKDVTQKDRAQALFAAGDHAEAERVLEALLAADPDDPDLLRRLAAVEAAKGDLESARQLIDRALLLAPGDGDIQLSRAYILLWSSNLDAARRQATILSTEHPDYPGLSAFERSLGQVLARRKLQLGSLHLGANGSEAQFSGGRTESWSSQHAAATMRWADSSTASLSIEREVREDVDTQIQVRLDLPLATHRLFLTGSMTPNPDFRASWSTGIGGEIEAGSAGHLLLDAGYADYRRVEVVAFRAGYRHRFSKQLSATARTIHLLGGGESYRLGAVGRIDYTPRAAPHVFAIVARYPDTEIDGTRQLNSVATGIRFALSDRLVLRVAGGHESRAASYDRTHVGLDLTWHLGGER